MVPPPMIPHIKGAVLPPNLIGRPTYKLHFSVVPGSIAVIVLIIVIVIVIGTSRSGTLSSGKDTADVKRNGGPVFACKERRVSTTGVDRSPETLSHFVTLQLRYLRSHCGGLPLFPLPLRVGRTAWAGCANSGQGCEARRVWLH
jgi:hypothetical protein